MSGDGSIILAAQLEVGLRVRAHRAYHRGVGADVDVAAVAAELVFGHIRFVMLLPGSCAPGGVPCRNAVRSTGNKPY